MKSKTKIMKVEASAAEIWRVICGTSAPRIHGDAQPGIQPDLREKPRRPVNPTFEVVENWFFLEHASARCMTTRMNVFADAER